MQRLSQLFSAAGLCVATIATMPAASAQAQHAQTAAHTEQATELSSGVIVKVDKDLAKLTIKHGPLANLKMPGMTMVFKVKQADMLDQVATGDKINFLAESVNGALTVIVLETVK